jgi:hypothetical protein
MITAEENNILMHQSFVRVLKEKMRTYGEMLIQAHKEIKRLKRKVRKQKCLSS